MLWDINLSQSTPEQTIFQHFHEGQHCVLSTDHKQNIQSIFKPGAQVFLYIRPDFSEDFSTPYKTFHGSQGSWATQLHILPQHGCLLYQFLSISKLIELPFKITCLFSLPSCSRATLFSWLKKKPTTPSSNFQAEVIHCSCTKLCSYASIVCSLITSLPHGCSWGCAPLSSFNLDFEA